MDWGDLILGTLVLAVILVLALLMYSSVASPPTRCIGGYTFTNDHGFGSPVQIFDENGHGVRCVEVAK